ncbi:hypothetical protein Ahy_A03g010174 [Arachis hypogaea]|uniref:Uncharacterized protein n=1 Tax=Arachis hypogaea TaxID=3818 RepID=A0A445DLE2_ARAHY|nr:hypothetical protein Ahy_A03g010174 [Arachis hypogaea]
MSEAKKAIVQDLGFSGLIHIPAMNVPYKLLKQLAYSFDLSRNKLDIWKKQKEKKKTISLESEIVAESESDSEDDSEETSTRRKQPKRMAKNFSQPQQESHEEVAPTNVCSLAQALNNAIMLVVNAALKNNF